MIGGGWDVRHYEIAGITHCDDLRCDSAVSGQTCAMTQGLTRGYELWARYPAVRSPRLPVYPMATSFECNLGVMIARQVRRSLPGCVRTRPDPRRPKPLRPSRELPAMAAETLRLSGYLVAAPVVRGPRH